VKPKYSLASSTWNEEEILAIQNVIKTGNYSMGENVAQFEREFAEYIGSKFAVMVNSGSSANLALLSACRFANNQKLQPGDEIIVPAVSWSTTYYPVSQIGCVLKFVDIDIDTLNIDISKIEEAITPKTKAILVVNLLGNPANWDSLKAIAELHNLILLEDNCESLGAEFGGKKAGTFGLGGTFSTFFSHHISTMEGGLIATDDLEIYQTMKSIRAHGWTRDLPPENHVFNKTGDKWDDLFRFVIPGYNLRPLEMEGAIGSCQLKKLPSFIEARRENAIYFKNQIACFESFRTQKEIGRSSWFGFSIILEGRMQGKRKQLVAELEKAGIESRPIVTGNFTRNPVIKHLEHASIPELPSANLIHDHGLFVGNHHFNLKKEIDLLLEVLSNFSEGNRNA
jgi:CDP-6-deoxy-D-xylo-4-hexulose-3-dehydrase